MAISEEDRHGLYSRLEVVLGHGEADTLMDHLPPVGWVEVATKRDLDALAERTDLRFDALSADVDRNFAEQAAQLVSLSKQVQKNLHTTLTFVVAVLAVFAAFIAALIKV